MVRLQYLPNLDRVVGYSVEDPTYDTVNRRQGTREGISRFRRVIAGRNRGVPQVLLGIKILYLERRLTVPDPWNLCTFRVSEPLLQESKV